MDRNVSYVFPTDLFVNREQNNYENNYARRTWRR